MIKIDFHTHSSHSPDGGITPDQYAQILEQNTLDYIAVTDHNTTSLAQTLRKNLGDRIIVGEEIMTSQGELIGLFLQETIQPHQSALETAQAIRAQGGFVYVPHPFERVRSGINETDLEHIVDLVDIIEVYNGRAFAQDKGPKATTWARLHAKVTAASSDAHGVKGLGTAYTIIKEKPTPSSLLAQLQTAHLHMHRPPLSSLLYPKINRLRKGFRA